MNENDSHNSDGKKGTWKDIMELAIALFIGAWLSVSCILAYLGLRKDFEPFLKDGVSGKKETETGIRKSRR